MQLAVALIKWFVVEAKCHSRGALERHFTKSHVTATCRRGQHLQSSHTRRIAYEDNVQLTVSHCRGWSDSKSPAEARPIGDDNQEVESPLTIDVWRLDFDFHAAVPENSGERAIKVDKVV